MALGNRVKQIREAKKLSQAELAEKVGISQQAIGLLEQRDSDSSKFLVELAKALEVSPEWLKTGTNSKEITHNNLLTPAELLAQQLKQFASEGKLSPDDINFINNTLQHLVKLKESQDAVANGTAPDKKSA